MGRPSPPTENEGVACPVCDEPCATAGPAIGSSVTVHYRALHTDQTVVHNHRLVSSRAPDGDGVRAANAGTQSASDGVCVIVLFVSGAYRTTDDAIDRAIFAALEATCALRSGVLAQRVDWSDLSARFVGLPIAHASSASAGPRRVPPVPPSQLPGTWWESGRPWCCLSAAARCASRGCWRRRTRRSRDSGGAAGDPRARRSRRARPGVRTALRHRQALSRVCTLRRWRFDRAERARRGRGCRRCHLCRAAGARGQVGAPGRSPEVRLCRPR
jgi:hypothetical protein